MRLQPSEVLGLRRHSVWLREAAAGAATTVAGGSMTHRKHTHVNSQLGTWTQRMHGHGSTCGTLIQHVFFFHGLFVLHKSL